MMNKEEAISTLITIKMLFDNSYAREALDIAIEELKTNRLSGEWQRVDEQPYFRKHYHKVCCSVCHKQGSEKYNYCPNCGADMRGEKRVND